jgi:hypothetical protein
MLMNKTTSQEMLAHAEKLCAQRGVRLTPQRLEVLRLMSLQQGAISAYDLLDLLREKEPQAKPPTVYRALEFLLEQGSCTRWNRPTATCCAIFSISRPIAQPCLSATAAAWSKKSVPKALKTLCIRWRPEWVLRYATM